MLSESFLYNFLEYKTSKLVKISNMDYLMKTIVHDFLVFIFEIKESFSNNEKYT